MTVAMIAAVSLVASGLLVAGVAAVPDGSFRQEVEKWRAKHEADYRREYVGLAGLFSLKSGPNSIGSAASNDLVLPQTAPAVVGKILLDGTHVRFEPQPGAHVTIKGRAVNGPIELKHDEEKSGPDELEVGGIALWVHLSGDRRTIRMRDDNGEVARSFAGFQWFPIDAGSSKTRRHASCTSPISWAMISCSRPRAQLSSSLTSRPSACVR
jgi:hypothetical protein